jgi:polygalacturonase
MEFKLKDKPMQPTYFRISRKFSNHCHLPASIWNKLKQVVSLTVVLIFLLSTGYNTLVGQEAPEEIAPIDAPFDMPQLERPDFPDQTFSVMDYGANADGEDGEKDTEAIHKAIEACHKAGGGTVLFPEGHWHTGPIRVMFDNINLRIAEGAVVHFSTDIEDYLPLVKVRHEGVEAYNYCPPIYAPHVTNFAVTGKGKLDGNGDEFWYEWATGGGSREEAAKYRLPRRKNFGKGGGVEGMRPTFLVPWKGENVLIEGITMENSPMWNVHPVYCKNVIVRDIEVYAPSNSPNTDGINPDGCKNVLIEYNHFNVGDDAIPIKSGLDEDGLRIDIPSKNIVVRHISATGEHVYGGITIGSEVSGGVENIYAHDLTFEGMPAGIKLKSGRGRGNVVKNIYIEDVEMKDMVGNAIYICPNEYGGRGVASLFKDIHISGVTINGAKRAIYAYGLPEKWITGIRLKNIEINNAEEGALIQRTKDLVLDNVSIQAEKGPALTIDDVIEGKFKGLSLEPEKEKPAMLLKGDETRFISLDDSVPGEEIEFGEGVSEDLMDRIEND